ncbi:MAG: carbon-nitrogen hydrolase family protein [Actinomycetota bacterium]
MSRPVTFASLQLRPIPFDVEATVDKLEREARRLVASFPQIDLLLFPELYPTGEDPFGPGEPPGFTERVAEPVPGPLSERLGRLAAGIGRYLVPGSVLERGTSGAIHNTAIVLGPDGRLLTSYRKLFPWRPHERTVPGDGTGRVIDLPGLGRVGLLICYDGWFPEVARGLALDGAEVLLQPTLTTTADREEEIVLARANAIVNQCYVVNVNALGSRGGGRSVTVDPDGHVLTELGTQETFSIDVVDLDRVAQVRERGLRGVSRPWRQLLDEAPAAAFEPYRRFLSSAP